LGQKTPASKTTCPPKKDAPMLRLLVLLLWLPCAALSQSIPTPLSDSVNDYAGMLSIDETAGLSATLRQARAETGVHIVLTTIKQQSDYDNSERFADFATKWFNVWGIGDTTKNDGILILVSRDDHEMRIVLGDAYGPVWDGRAQRVIDTAMLPAFRAGDYPRGLADGVASAIARLARPYAAQENVTQTSGFPEDKNASHWPAIAMFVAMVLLIGWNAAKDRISGAFLKLKRCPNCGSPGLLREDETVQPATKTTLGLMNRHIRCPSCGNDQVTQRRLPALQSARKSDGGGFGGGRSSGGGASGKW